MPESHFFKVTCQRDGLAIDYLYPVSILPLAEVARSPRPLFNNQRFYSADVTIARTSRQISADLFLCYLPKQCATFQPYPPSHLLFHRSLFHSSRCSLDPDKKAIIEKAVDTLKEKKKKMLDKVGSENWRLVFCDIS